MNKTLTFCIVFCMILLCSGSSRAALIFFDNFDSYTNPGLNWQGQGNWATTDQAVDLIGSGASGDLYDLLPGNGYYVDMDGSMSHAGTIESIGILLAAGDYNLIFDIAGNQRGYQDDAVNVLISGGLLSGSVTSIASSMPFTTITMPFTVACATTATISFSGVGGDNVGALLDNVGIDSIGSTGGNQIPAPGALLLGSIGAGFVGWLRRRRTL